MNIYIKKLNVIGGISTSGVHGSGGDHQTSVPEKAANGKIGTNGYAGGNGGNGGNGGAGIWYFGYVNIFSPSIVICTGGNGCTGGEGGDAVFFGASGKDGGRGGAGALAVTVVMVVQEEKEYLPKKLQVNLQLLMVPMEKEEQVVLEELAVMVD